jgi:hypothetical protein
MWLDAARLGLSPEDTRALAAGLVVLAAAASVAGALRTGARRLAVALGLGWVCALPSEDDTHLSLAVVLGTLASVAAIAILSRAGVGAPRGLRVLRAWLFRASDARFDLAMGLAVTSITVGLSYAMFDWEPVVQDSQAQLFHARIFLRGHLVAPSPPSPAHFLADHVIVEPAFYSQYPPGHTALLALGEALGVPFLVNPALGAATLLLLRRVGEALFDRRTGRRAALLALASPFVLWMSSEAMNHATALVLVLLGMLSLARTSSTGRAGWSLLAGAALGGVLLVRPVTAIALGLPLGLWTLRELRGRPALLVPMLASSAAMGALLLAFNAATNGDPLLMGYLVRWGPSHSLGFHPSPWGAPHTPWRGLDHTLSNLDGASVFLWGGAFPGLALVALGALRERARPLTWALVAMPLAVLVIYFFYFFQDLTFGPRYLYEASPTFFLLGARGLRALREEALRAAPRRAERTLAHATLVAALVPFLHFLPALFHQYQVGYCPRGHVVERAERAIPTGRALVFVDGAYERAFFRVDPWLEARILYARDLDAANDALRCAMSDREAWLARGDELERLPAIDCDARRAR